MVLGEIDGIIINPVKLKEQCTLIAQNYDYENASYVLLSNCVNQLCEEDELRSNAITGFKSQMSNYKSVFDALCYANELDKYDINTLISILDSELGSDILDGTEILGKIAQAEGDCERYESQKDYWYSEYMDAKWHEIIYMDLCYYTYKYYEKLVDDAAEDMEYWQGRGELLLNIAAQSDGLFLNGNEFRDCVNEGINQIATAFDVDTNTYLTGDTSWKNALSTLIEDSIYTETDEINWGLVNQILSKDADAISDTEYMLIAYAYMNADVDELNDFFMMCRVPEDVDRATWLILWNNNKLDTVSLGNMDIVTLDSAKIDAVCRQANIYQANLLAVIRHGDLDASVKDTLTAERNDIVQRITMAQTLDGIHSFYGYRDNNFFNFERSDDGFGTDESLKVTYNSLMYAGELCPASLESHTLTVTNTLTDSGLSAFLTYELRSASLKELTSYSTAIVGDNIGDQVVDAVLEKIPYAGIATFGLGIAEDIYENERKYAFINNSYDASEAGVIATYFDCCGNVVLYDDNTVSVSIYEGIHTDQRVEEISNLLGDSNLDMEYLIENTGEVFQTCYDYMKEYGDTEFEKIVEGD